MADNPNVIDKRRFADRINDEDVKQMIRDDREEVRSMHTGPGFPQVADGLLSPASYSPSSTPSDKPGMDFPTAIKQVMKGHRVTRLEWENPEIWLMMFYWGAINPKVPAGKYLSIHFADGAMSPLYVNDGDLLGDDWVVVV